MKEELVQYTLLGIEVLEFTLPADDKYDAVEIDDVMWHYAYFLDFAPFSKDRIKLSVNYSYFMSLKDDPAREKITYIKTRSSFSVTAALSPDAKITILAHMLHIAVWNLEGVYAAKTENTHWAEMLPAQHNLDEDVETLKTQIHERWK